MTETLARTLAHWKAGEPVTSLRLGHGDQDIRQDVAHDLAFNLIEQGAPAMPMAFETFLEFSRERAKEYGKRVCAVTQHEFEAAYSLAFAALKNGWERTMAGHAEHNYISVRRKPNGTEG